MYVAPNGVLSPQPSRPASVRTRTMVASKLRYSRPPDRRYVPPAYGRSTWNTSIAAILMCAKIDRAPFYGHTRSHSGQCGQRGSDVRAVLLTGHGGLDKLVYRDDVPDPVPGPGDVLVRVGAAGINNTDIWTREGAYGAQDDPAKVNGWRREALSFPLIQGADIVGSIVAVGDAVSADRVGERVIVDSALYSGNGDGLLDAGI